MTAANPAWVIDAPAPHGPVKEPYRLYINSRFVGRFATPEGVWSRIGQAPFGSGHIVTSDDPEVSVSDFVPY